MKASQNGSSDYGSRTSGKFCLVDYIQIFSCFQASKWPVIRMTHMKRLPSVFVSYNLFLNPKTKLSAPNFSLDWSWGWLSAKIGIVVLYHEEGNYFLEEYGASSITAETDLRKMHFTQPRIICLRSQIQRRTKQLGFTERRLKPLVYPGN